MLALGLLLTVSAALWRSMQLTFETKGRVTSINERYHEARMTLVRMSRELRMALLIKPVPEVLREEDPAVVTRFKGDDDSLHFATTAHIPLYANAPESDQTEISYELKQPAKRNGYDGKTLYRREASRIDDRPKKGGAVWPVVDGVKELKFEYFDDKGDFGGESWRSDWDSDDDELLPQRVRITLILESKDGQDITMVAQAAPRIRHATSPVAHLFDDGCGGCKEGFECDTEQSPAKCMPL
jgi:type II secretory pathway component PulJ